MTCNSAAGNEIVFDNSGYISVKSESADYGLSMTHNENYPTDWFSISIAGQGADQVEMEMAENGYILTADQLTNVHVYANNRDVKAEVSFSADTDKVFIYEIDEETIGVAIDTDDDGTYDKTIAQSEKSSAPDNLGDVSGDGIINASDAAKILIASASVGAGNPSGFTAEQEALADVNGDGIFNASDAAVVLIYAAAVGAGNTDAKITDFVH